ncbi:MAG: TetR/AcrR family transcriptional regulator [Actinomycetia bacterium]|nr:TetR/AcrR family transcriptional regulator [Actinomycetes bacterium]
MPRVYYADQPTTRESAVPHRILDAAEECLRRFGAADTTMEDIAEAAGMSRATLYRYFDGREGVLLGVAGRDVDRYLARLGARLDGLAGAEDALLEFSTRVIHAASRDDTLALLFGHHDPGRSGPPAGAFDMLFARTVSFLSPYLEAWQQAGSVRSELDPRDAAEWTLRVVTSLIMIPGLARRQGEELEDYLRLFLLPALVPSHHTS